MKVIAPSGLQGLRIDPVCFLAACCKRRLNQALVYHCLSMVLSLCCCVLGQLFRSTSKSRPNNIRGGKNVRPSVRPQKVSSISMKFGILVEVDE